MSKIKIIPFGGQDERGKNCFVVEIENGLYIFDMGLKLPESSLLGIDVIIPNYDYLHENSNRIKGIFLSNASGYNRGSLQYFIKKTDVNVYCNELSSIMIKSRNLKVRLEHRNSKIISIKDGDVIEFDKVKIEAFKTTACFPGSLNYALHFNNETFVYLSDFIFDGEEKDFYSANYEHMFDISKNNIMGLMIDSEYASRQGFTAPNHKINKYISSIIKEKSKRIIFAIFEEDIFNMTEIIKSAKETGKQICVYEHLLNQIIKNDIVKNYLNLDDDDLSTFEEFEDSDDQVLILSASGETLYAMLARIALGNDTNIHLRETDIVVIATPPAPGVERRHADVLDELSRTDAKIISLSEKNLWSMRASYEDVKLAINMFKPKYVIPVKGLYKDFLGTKKAAIDCNINEDNVIILDTGDCLTIETDQKPKIKKKFLVISDVFVDGIGIGDISDMILYERKILGNDGAIVIGVNIDTDTKKILSLIDIQMRGLIYLQEGSQLFSQIHSTVVEGIEKSEENFKTNPEEYNLSLIKKEIMNKLRIIIKKDTGKTPIILLIISEIKEFANKNELNSK